MLVLLIENHVKYQRCLNKTWNVLDENSFKECEETVNELHWNICSFVGVKKHEVPLPAAAFCTLLQNDPVCGPLDKSIFHPSTCSLRGKFPEQNCYDSEDLTEKKRERKITEQATVVLQRQRFVPLSEGLYSPNLSLSNRKMGNCPQSSQLTLT